MKQHPITARVIQSTRFAVLSVACGLIFTSSLIAQTALPLNDLSSFKNSGTNWQICGDVAAPLDQPNSLKTVKGRGVLVNSPEKNQHSVDLYSNQDFADLDLELDYMMAKGSNSGIYLQGRYEIQLLDSWGTLRPRAGDNGGIYERWDDNRGKGNEGYDGHAPRQNVSRAPGLWQHLKISFQAPRFDANGRKIENARMLKVELNGVVIHDNVELQGPTRGAMGNDEVAAGPLRIQGDHGAVAFRNISFVNYDKPRPDLSDLKYNIYSGKYEDRPDVVRLTSEAEGTSPLLSSAVIKKDNEYLIRYAGNINIKAAGEYRFHLNATGGAGSLVINKQVAIPFNKTESQPVKLPAGKLPFELLYSKFVSWEKSGLGLSVSSPNIREFLLSDPSTAPVDETDPILVDASSNIIMRSFMDIPGGKRIVHAVSAGSPLQLNYTYDLDRGMLLQVWRGGFLDATPMWHDRGDGSSRPIGSVLHFGDPAFAVQKLASAQTEWSNDTTGTGYQPKGYEVDAQNNPSFKYYINGAKVTDALQVVENGQALKRTLSIENSPGGLYVRIADGKSIEPVSKGLYLVDDKTYYVRIDDADGANPVIREIGGRKELLVPVQSNLSYSILF